MAPRINARDLEEFERCPRAFYLKKSGGRGSALYSRPLIRYQGISDAIVAAHRQEPIPVYETMKAALTAGSRDFVPANVEERGAVLEMLETYAEAAAELGGSFFELENPFLEHTSRKSGITLAGYEGLLFEHGHEIEARRISTSQYARETQGDELAIEFAGHVRSLLLLAQFPKRRLRLTEVNVATRSVSSIGKGPETANESGAAITHFASLVSAKSKGEATPNFLCGTCAYMPDCPAIPTELW